MTISSLFNCSLKRFCPLRAFTTTKTTTPTTNTKTKTKSLFNPFKPTQVNGFLRSFGGAFPPLNPLPLPPSLFAVPARLDLIHRVVCWFRDGERLGLASAKGRGEVAGSNRKIHAQKGTGRARAGDARAPHRRGGTNSDIRINFTIISLSLSFVL